MYRLENDVQWTDELKDAFKHNITRASIIYNQTEINEENNLSSLTLEEQRYISNLGFIGSATARKLEVNLIDSTGSINLENKEVTLKIGADIQSIKLPDGYTEVDYIKSTGGQYINTGITANSSLRVVLDMKYEDISAINNTNFGTIVSDSGSYLRYHFMVRNNNFIFYCGTRSTTLTEADMYRHLIDLDAVNQVAKIDNNTFELTNVQSFDTGYDFWLFARNGNASNLIYYNNSRLYGSKMYVNGILVRDFVPCFRNSDNEVGLYDTVNNVFYTNNGTGNFTYGNIKQPETVYINYGNFIVDKAPEVDETNGTIRVVAYDYMVKFDKPYVDRVTYPCTLLVLLQDICSQAGVTLGTTNFANKTFLVTDNQFEGATLRDVLTNIAKCAFSWARIGQDNKLYLDFSLTADNIESITIDDYLVNSFKKANEYYGPVNQVTYADSSFDGQESRVKDQQSIDANGLKELVIYDNLFAYTPDKRDSLIQAGTSILGLRYMPVTQLDLIGLVYLDSRDIIQIGTLAEEVFTTRVFNHTIKYNGASTDSVVTEGTSNNEEAYKNTAANAFQNQQVRFILNKATKQIQLIVEQTADIGDITVNRGSSIGRVEFTKINQSEPIRVEIKPLGENISYLYPRNNLFPANDLYITLRTLRFTNTTTNEKFDYILPDDLLYYDSENFDDFVLDYNAHTVIINKKCKYDANGNVVLLAQPRVDSYTYPKINLTDGDYKVEILKYDNTPYAAYLFCKLMVQNIYTTQFSTKTETTSKIELSEQNINLSVNQKLQNYSTTTQMNAAINLSSQSIMSVVSRKVGDDEVISKINQSAEALTIDANKININGTISANGNFKINTNGTMECVNAIISGEITSSSGTIGGFTIESTYIANGTTSLAGANNSVYLGTNGISCGTTFKVTKAGQITASSGTIGGFTIGSTYIANGTTSLAGANNSVYLGTDGISCGTTFKVTKAGAITSSSGTIGGFTIGSTKLYNNKSTLTANSNGVYIGTDGISCGTGSTFKVTTSGEVTCSNINVIGGKIKLANGSTANPNFQIGDYLFMTGGYINIGKSGIDDSRIELVASTTDPAGIYLNYSGYYTEVMASGITTPIVIQTSKESKKKNIELYKDNALNIIKNSEIYTYNFKAEKDEDKKHIGFIIGDEGGKYKTPSEVISINGEGIDSYTMSSILWKAMQEILERLGDE